MKNRMLALYDHLRDKFQLIIDPDTAQPYFAAIGIDAKDMIRIFAPDRKPGQKPCIYLYRETKGRSSALDTDELMITVGVIALQPAECEKGAMLINDLLSGYTVLTSDIIVYRCFNEDGPMEPYLDRESNFWECASRYRVLLGSNT